MVSEYDYVFRNSGKEVYNDTVGIGSAFLLAGFKYAFRVLPDCPYWRFGIRLSKHESIDFFHPQHRYKRPEFAKYVDLHLGVGNWNNNNWSNPDMFHFIQYNLELEKENLFNSDKYISNQAIEWLLEMDELNSTLQITIKSGDHIYFEKDLQIPTALKYFQIFSWADQSDYLISANLKVESSLTIDDLDEIQEVKMGNITLIKGDMFAKNNFEESNIIILPVNSEGGVSTQIDKNIKEYGLEIPKERNELLYFISTPPKKTNKIFIAAYSVSQNRTLLSRIEKICKDLINYRARNPANQLLTVAIPLLGTGFGKLNPFQVFKIYDEVFNTNKHSYHFKVCIINPEFFRSILSNYIGKFSIVDKNTSIPIKVMEIERQLKIKLPIDGYELDENKEIISLHLESVDLTDTQIANLCPTLISLSLNNCTWETFDFLKEFKNLKKLIISYTPIQDLGFLKNAGPLNHLEINNTTLISLSGITNQIELEVLHLPYNSIFEIDDLRNLHKLKDLDLSYNNIRHIDILENLKHLYSLNIAHNNISTLKPLINLTNLNVLRASGNNIENVYDILQFESLAELYIDENPWSRETSLKLSPYDNQVTTVTNYVTRQDSERKAEFSLPVKVMLLGNHASGKSTLLEYLKHGTIDETITSTHIIRIEKYPVSSTFIPKAYFFDFGGQDYYHGIYRAFLSSGSIYILLWNTTNNQNKRRTDIFGYSTQDFTLKYWLSQKKYLETEKFHENDAPVLIVQTHADENTKVPFSITQPEKYAIRNDFYISLKKQTTPTIGKTSLISSLKYLQDSIDDLIEEKKITESQPEWYINFINYLIDKSTNTNHNATKLSSILKHYKRKHPNKLNFLKDDLDQLHKQGLVLYYKDQMPDVVWLNPVSLVKYVHDKVLNKSTIGVFRGITPLSAFKEFDVDIINLLENQKVIFKHEYGERIISNPTGIEYITPNFLPLSSENKLSYDMFTFGLGSPIFTLKFICFLPFGLINQLICFFGNLQEKKLFWRDQLLFTFRDNTKVLISIDLENLEIRTYAHFDRSMLAIDKQRVTSYLFYVIVGKYWDLEILEYPEFIDYKNKTLSQDKFDTESIMYKKIGHANNFYDREECRPSDLYVSVDDKQFIKYSELFKLDNSPFITSKQMNEYHELSELSRPILAYSFQPFINKTLRKQKKVVISYSKKDLEYINVFKSYMVPLSAAGLIDDPWHCTELVAGDKWNDQIQAKFDEADIIFFMISDHLMATQYVLDHEIKNAIDRWNKDQSIKIIPIILVHYEWQREGPYDLSVFTGLPYTLKPINDFPDQKVAWHTITKSVRYMIEKDQNPLKENTVLDGELKKIYENIVNDRLTIPNPS